VLLYALSFQLEWF